MDVDGSDSTSEPRPRPRKRRRGGRPALATVEVGPLGCYVLVAGVQARLHTSIPFYEGDEDAEAFMTDGEMRVACVVLGRWHLLSCDSVIDDEPSGALRSRRGRDVRNRLCGHIV